MTDKKVTNGHGRVRSEDIFLVLNDLEKVSARVSAIEAFLPFRDKSGSKALISLSFPFKKNDSDNAVRTSYQYYRQELKNFDYKDKDLYYELWIY